MRLKIPGWVEGQLVASDLYFFVRAAPAWPGQGGNPKGASER